VAGPCGAPYGFGGRGGGKANGQQRCRGHGAQSGKSRRGGGREGRGGAPAAGGDLWRSHPLRGTRRPTRREHVYKNIYHGGRVLASRGRLKAQGSAGSSQVGRRCLGGGRGGRGGRTPKGRGEGGIARVCRLRWRNERRHGRLGIGGWHPQPRRKKMLDGGGDGKRAFGRGAEKRQGKKTQRASSNAWCPIVHSLAQCTMPCAATRKPGGDPPTASRRRAGGEEGEGPGGRKSRR
jgi:hypothetical protein